MLLDAASFDERLLSLLLHVTVLLELPYLALLLHLALLLLHLTLLPLHLPSLLLLRLLLQLLALLLRLLLEPRALLLRLPLQLLGLLLRLPFRLRLWLLRFLNLPLLILQDRPWRLDPLRSFIGDGLRSRYLARPKHERRQYHTQHRDSCLMLAHGSRLLRRIEYRADALGEIPIAERNTGRLSTAARCHQLDKQQRVIR